MIKLPSSSVRWVARKTVKVPVAVSRNRSSARPNLNWRTVLDSRSKKGMAMCKKILKDEGLLVMDAHLGTLDILATFNELTQNLPIEKVVMPVAGYHFFVPITRAVLRGIDKPDKGMMTLPVYRKEEWVGGGWWRLWRFLYLKRFTRNHTRWFNKYYLSEAEKALDMKNQAVLLAPYGGPSSYGTTVRRGVAKLLRKGGPAVCTLTTFEWRHMRFKVYLLPYVMRFKRYTSIDEINKSVHFAFKSLEAWRSSGEKIIH